MRWRLLRILTDTLVLLTPLLRGLITPLLQELKHKNIVALHDVLHSERKLTLVFEHCDQGKSGRRQSKRWQCEGRKELAHPMVRLQLILFSKRTGAFQFRTFGGFVHVPSTQIYCLSGAIISQTHITNIYLNTVAQLWLGCSGADTSLQCCGSTLVSMRIWMQHFLSMRIRIKIQGFDDQILEKIYSRFFFFKNCNFFYPQAPKKDVQATGEVFIPQKRTSNTSKVRFVHFWVILVPPDPDPIRIPSADPNPAEQNECGSGSTTLDSWRWILKREICNSTAVLNNDLVSQRLTIKDESNQNFMCLSYSE